jgi:hypothetical protein
MMAMTIIFFLFSANIYADEEFLIKERSLLERGYTKTTPHYYNSTWILQDCYEKIFNKNWIFEPPAGIMRFSELELGDGLFYVLFYLLGEELPNILTIAYLENDGVVYSYYKMNLALEGVVMSTTIGELLVFI